MHFKLSINTDNAAFHDEDEVPMQGEIGTANFSEVARILRALADRIDVHGCGFYHQNVKDSNGNNIGTAVYTID